MALIVINDTSSTTLLVERNVKGNYFIIIDRNGLLIERVPTCLLTSVS